MLFARSTLNRSRGETQQRALDEVRSAWARVEWAALAGRWSHRPGGGGTAVRRAAAALEEAGHQTARL